MFAQGVSSDRKREPGASWAATLATTAPMLLAIPISRLQLGGGRMWLIASCVPVIGFALATLLIRRGRIVVAANGRTRWRRDDSPGS